MRNAQRLLQLFVIVGLAHLFSGATASASVAAEGQGTIALTNPSSAGTEVGETGDYRSLIWKDAWDMNNAGDLAQLDSPCVQANQFSASDFSGGVWTGTPNPVYGEDHWIFLLSPGYRGALSEGLDGRLQPIDPKVYTQLTIKMFVSSVDTVADPGARLLWTRTDVKSFGNGQEANEWGESNYFRTYSGWHIYSLDLTQIGLLSFSQGKLNWTAADIITGLRLDPDQKSAGKSIKIDWVRLSAKSNYPVAWTAAGVGGSTAVQFAVDSGDAAGATPIHFYAGNVQFNVTQEEKVLANAHSFAFPASLPPGDQQLQATVDGNPDTGIWTVNADPILTFTNPSMTSGEEYAQSALNDPWDFKTLGDVAKTENVASAAIENETFQGSHVATGGACSQNWSDSALFLRVGAPIDSSKYRYLSFKTRLEGTADISFGWISRLIWYDATGFPNVGTSNDIINRDGWNTHSIDLWRADLRDDEDPGQRGWQEGAVHQLRIDVDEVPAAQTFYLDDVELHAEPVGAGSFTAAWSLTGDARSSAAADAATITLGYDTDAQGYNGTVIATGITGNQYVWDTANVAAGRYYLYAIVNDGVNETRFYSDVPVRIVCAASRLACEEALLTPTQAVVSSSLSGQWAEGNLIDGVAGSVWSSAAHYAHMQEAEWAVVTLAQRANVDRLRVIPRPDYVNTSSTLGFPKDFIVQYAINGSDERGAMTCNPSDNRFSRIDNWRPLLTYFGYAQPANAPLDFPFGAHAADCLRILGTELSQDDYGSRLMQFADLELYAGQTKLTPAQAVVSSSLSGQWAGAYLIDGVAGSVWSSAAHYAHMQEAESAALLLPQRANVDRLRVIPRPDYVNTSSTLGFPKDFIVQYAINGSDERGAMTCDPADGRFNNITNWRPLLTYFGYAQPANAPLDFPFGVHAADCLRILGTELSQDDYGSRLMQFADLELYAGQTKLTPAQAVVSSILSGQWAEGNLIDGVAGSVWSSAAHYAHMQEAEWAVVTLPQRANVNRLRAIPRPDYVNTSSTLGFPKDFIVQYAINGSDERGEMTCNPADGRFNNITNWRPLLTYFGYAQPANAPLDFPFGAHAADCLRILGTELSQDDYGSRLMQFADLELYANARNVVSRNETTLPRLAGPKAEWRLYLPATNR